MMIHLRGVLHSHLVYLDVCGTAGMSRMWTYHGMTMQLGECARRVVGIVLSDALVFLPSLLYNCKLVWQLVATYVLAPRRSVVSSMLQWQDGRAVYGV